MPTPEVAQFRQDPPRVAGERPMYQAWLDFHRGTLLWKCAALNDAQLKSASVPPSNMTLLGLVRHMSEVERSWYRIRAAGLSLPDLYCTEDDQDGDFDNVTDADATQDLATFKVECLAADEAVREMSLDDILLAAKDPISLRWVYVHMIEEYARHNGHADLLRESIDGATGD
ncbi:MAG: DinB family protein [Dermatophilaceae bacterium]